MDENNKLPEENTNNPEDLEARIKAMETELERLKASVSAENSKEKTDDHKTEGADLNKESASEEYVSATKKAKKPKGRLIGIIAGIAGGCCAIAIIIMLILGIGGSDGGNNSGSGNGGSTGGETEGDHSHTPSTAVIENKVDAGCTTDGSYDKVVYCSVCNAEMSRISGILSAIGHTPEDAVIENEVAASCTAKGSYDEVVYCCECDVKLSHITVHTDKLPHTPSDAVIENKVDATNQTNGSYDEVIYCSECGSEISRTEKIIPALGHVPADAVIENKVDASCTIDGSYDEVVYCSVCSTEISRTEKIITASGHTPANAVAENEVAASCTTNGSYDEVVYCSVCSTEVSRTGKIITASGHTPANAVAENEVAASCTTNGSYDEVVYCSVCSTEISRTAITTDFAKHNYNDDNICSDCGSNYVSEGLEFKLSDDGSYYSVTGIGSCEDVDIVIPSTYNSLPVSSIGEGAFEDCDDLIGVIIPDSVTVIGRAAFYSCSNITSVVIPSNLTVIENAAFSGCVKLVEIINHSSLNLRLGSYDYGYIAEHALEIHTGKSKIVNTGDYVFYSFDNKNYLVSYLGNSSEPVLPESYNGEGYAINEYAFYDCDDITNVVLSSGVTSIYDEAFMSCNNITFNEYDNGYYLGSESNPYYAIISLKSDAESCIIHNDTEIIARSAFNSKIKNVVIGESIKHIDDYAFFGCLELISIDIPDNVLTIGEHAFNSCSRLISVKIGSGVTEIKEQAFVRCFKIMEVVNNSSLDITIGSTDHGLVGNHAKDIHTGESKIVNKNDYLFYTVGGTNYLLDYIGSETELSLPGDYNGEKYEIGKYAFTCREELTSVIIPDGVISIGPEAFSCCYGLTDISIPDSVTRIENLAFYYCSNLSSVSLPDSLISVGSGVFDYCPNIAINEYDNAYYIGNTSNPYLILLEGRSSTSCTIHPDTVVIADHAFSGYPNLQSITFPSSVKSIGSWAFYNTGIETLVFEEGSQLVNIDSHAFYNCDKLVDVVIPDSVLKIGDHAFADCLKLTSVVLGKGISEIGNDTFRQASALKYITIPNSVTAIKKYAFIHCNSLKDVYYTGTEEEWANISVEEYNTNLLSATIHYNYVP